MHSNVKSIAQAMSLRPPQRESLEILNQITELISLEKESDLQTALEIIKAQYPNVTDFERDFPSLCFSLATGVGKTRLMGAFIAYLHRTYGFNNFFVLAPNLTIYEKLKNDFTPNTPKYVFKGIPEFAVNSPLIITGDNYDQKGPGTTFDQVKQVKINVFNISKINSEVRGDKQPRIKRLNEYIGDSYYNYLAGLKDLVMIMDESHRYRAKQGIKALNELKPVLGLELTATPFVETGKNTAWFKNIIYNYTLAQAITNGFVKDPAVVTQKNFNPSQYSPEQLEQIKLEDGIRVHENIKVELETYARNNDRQIVKPFVLVIARDTTHAASLVNLIKSEKFFNGQYKDKVLQVDSSKNGAEEDEMIKKLLAIESPDEPTEIVIHVNMLKEGWDVTNLYTIVPLRAANARVLIEQTIGRGLRLPYGQRTGVAAIDRLNIIAHDKFQEIVDEANKPDSAIKLQQYIIDPEDNSSELEIITIQPVYEKLLGIPPLSALHDRQAVTNKTDASIKIDEVSIKVAQITLEKIQNHQHLPSSAELLEEETLNQLIGEVEEAIQLPQQILPGVTEKIDVRSIVKQTTQTFVQHSIDIPQILIEPDSEMTIEYEEFRLNLTGINFQPVSKEILIQSLQSREQETVGSYLEAQTENRLEDHIVNQLVGYNDIDYDKHASLLYELSEQLIDHLKNYLPDDTAIQNVLIAHRISLAKNIHAQMQAHQKELPIKFKSKVHKGFFPLKQKAATITKHLSIADFKLQVTNKNEIRKMAFGGFERCIFNTQKFDSDSERMMSVILDRDSSKWFRAESGHFRIFYNKQRHEQSEYIPDFCAETENLKYMIEIKAENEINNLIVTAKANAAVNWCHLASKHAQIYNGKHWQYLMVPHNVIAENMELPWLAKNYGVS